MANPLDSFPSEPGAQRCGDSFAQSLTVTGLLPQKGGFGSNLTHTIAAYVDATRLEESTWDPDAFFDILGAIDTTASRLRSQINEHAAWFSQGELASMTWLVDRAEVLASDAHATVDKWENRPWGPWSLWAGDTAQSIPDMDCTEFSWGVGNQLDDINAWIADEYEILGYEPAVCPLWPEQDARAADRIRMIQDLKGALSALRCADYHLHRTRLYRQAKQAWDELPGQPRPGGPPGFVATPMPIGPQVKLPTDVADPDPADDPTGPSDDAVPDTPPGGGLPGVDTLPPEGFVPAATPTPSAPGASKRRVWPWVAAGAAAAGVVGIVVGVTRL